MSTKIHTLHDKTFHALMQQRSFVVGILKMALPDEIQEKLTWSSLKLYQLDGRQVRDDLKQESQADVVYSGMLDSVESFFAIHVEHQSTPDPLLPIRLLNYQSGLLLAHGRANKCTELPPLISIVYYHGKPTPYPYSLDWLSCFKDTELAKRYTLKPILIDLGQTDDETITQAAPEIAGAQLAFKYIFSKDFSPYQVRVLAPLKQAPRIVRQITISYLVGRANIASDVLIEQSNKYLPNEEDYIMQLYQQQQQNWRDQGKQEGVQQGMQQGVQQGRQQGKQEGIQEGRQQGKIETAAKLIELGQTLDVITLATGLTPADIEALKKKTEETIE